MRTNAKDDSSKAERPTDETLGSYAFTLVIGIALVIGGLVLADYLARLLVTFDGPLYLISLCIGLIPIWWFVGRRKLHDYDWYDYGFLCVVAILAEVLHDVLAKRIGLEMNSILFCVTLIYFTWQVWRTIRGRRKAFSGRVV